MGITLALVAAAIGIGSTHTVAPDHWVPFAALARAEKWSAPRTALVTALCGVGHVTVSVALGLMGALFGLELLQTFGRRLESVAGFLLIGFGVVYGLWGVHRAVRAEWHDHGHAHPHWHVHHHEAAHQHRSPHEGRLTPWTLFLVFSADPCVAVIPLMFAAAPLGWPSALAVAAAYELATIATMVALVLPARVAATAVGGIWVDRYSDAVAGGVIAAVGLVVVQLGW
jgi:nickel/cobalt transporter (NicO) family protein